VSAFFTAELTVSAVCQASEVFKYIFELIILSCNSLSLYV